MMNFFCWVPVPDGIYVSLSPPSCDRRLTSATTKEWFRQLEAERDIPVLVCLTHADQLYVECLEEDPKTAESKTRADLYVSISLNFVNAI